MQLWKLSMCGSHFFFDVVDILLHVALEAPVHCAIPVAMCLRVKSEKQCVGNMDVEA